jgi:hypothetical protein
MVKVKNYTAEQLLIRVKSLQNYKALPTNYWLLGVRSEEDTEDVYDDKFYLFYGQKFVSVMSGTTNPGGSVLRGGFLKYNKAGAFILRSDMWHYDMWKPGLHKKTLRALVQNTKVIGFRDGNKNGKSEEIGSVVSGFFGINFHLNSSDFWSKALRWIIGGWSAGCQVTNVPEKYREVIELTKNQKTVSYCLLKEF